MRDTLPTLLRPRRATDADGSGVGRLIAAVFAEYDGCLFVEDEFPELAAIATHFEARGGAMWVAPEADGAIAGSIAVAPTQMTSPAAFQLFKFYVARAHRGGGLAGTLFDLAYERARAAGATTLELWTDTRFTRAHAFYRRRGFVFTGAERDLRDVSASREYHFRLTIPPAAST